MSAHALSLPKTRPANLRRFDMRRDLLAVADLVELCFANSLDADGRLYIRQMRQAARGGALLDLAAGSGEAPLMGMVWLEDGRVVGNLSLIPHNQAGRRLFLIANVAVHPDHQRRGIARQLTHAALEDLAERGMHETWLQVDENNRTAVRLYQELGFVERLRRTSWRLTPSRQHAGPEPGMALRARSAKDWPQQKSWLEAAYPPEVRWHLPLDFGLLRPGLLGGLQRTFGERRTEQWGAERAGHLLGVLTWQSSSLEADRLWLAAAPEHEAAAVPALIDLAHSRFSSRRKLALNYPAGRAAGALQAAGFQALRTLIWMRYPWEDHAA
jgi:ribosomal protein S18 acetylase RimI-like enzyme